MNEKVLKYEDACHFFFGTKKKKRILKIYTNFEFGLDLFSNGLWGVGSRFAKFHLLGDTNVREWQ
jgi:hypothetical protein